MESNHKIKIEQLPEQYSIHRFESNTSIPLSSLPRDSMFHISNTDQELSIVCSEKIKLGSDKCVGPYNCLRVVGPLDFSLVGIISHISDCLKKRDIPVFVISTYDTDYILINVGNAKAAIKALTEDEYISVITPN